MFLRGVDHLKRIPPLPAADAEAAERTAAVKAREEWTRKDEQALRRIVLNMVENLGKGDINVGPRRSNGKPHGGQPCHRGRDSYSISGSGL